MTPPYPLNCRALQDSAQHFLSPLSTLRLKLQFLTQPFFTESNTFRTKRYFLALLRLGTILFDCVQALYDSERKFFSLMALFDSEPHSRPATHFKDSKPNHTFFDSEQHFLSLPCALRLRTILFDSVQTLYDSEQKFFTPSTTFRHKTILFYFVMTPNNTFCRCRAL